MCHRSVPGSWEKTTAVFRTRTALIVVENRGMKWAAIRCGEKPALQTAFQFGFILLISILKNTCNRGHEKRMHRSRSAATGAIDLKRTLIDLNRTFAASPRSAR